MASGLDLLVRLQAVEYGSRRINIYHLVSADGTSLPPAEPGAHIDVEISKDFRRSYSLINASRNPGEYVIAVLASESGRGGSQAWHRESVVGGTYRISTPRNNFPLPDIDEAHLFAGGIGITPIISMYRYLRRTGKSARLFYWVRSEEDMLFAAELLGDPQATIFISGEVSAVRPRIGQLVEAAPASAHLFCCGPSGMMDEYAAASAARPPAMVHSEHFMGVEKPTGQNSFTVRLARLGVAIEVAPGQTILEACLGAGIDMAYSCEEGICGACEARVVSGAVEHRDSFRPAAEHDRLNTITVCCSVAKGSEITLDV